MQARRRYGPLQQLRALCRVADELSRSTYPDQVFELALDAIHGCLDVYRSSILLVDSDGVMRFRAWRGLSEEYREATTGHSPWKLDVRNPQPVLIPDASADSSLEPFRKVIETEGIWALAFVPLITEGRLIGKLLLYYNRPHAFDEGEIALALTLASFVAFHVERSTYVTKLMDSEAKRLSLLESSLDAVITIDNRGRIVDFNPAATKMFGLPPTMATGRRMVDMIIPHGLRERHRLGFKRYLETGVASILNRRIEMVALRADGSEFPVELTVTQVRLEGKPAFTACIRDITERKNG